MVVYFKYLFVRITLFLCELLLSFNISPQEGKAQPNGPCILCGHCVAICSSEAVSIPEYDMTEVELIGGNRTAFDIGDFLHTVKSRRSIRDYKDISIEHEKLEAVVQAGRYSATGANRQACRFVVVQDALQTLKDMIWNGVSELEQPAPPPLRSHARGRRHRLSIPKRARRVVCRRRQRGRRGAGCAEHGDGSRRAGDVRFV